MKINFCITTSCIATAAAVLFATPASADFTSAELTAILAAINAERSATSTTPTIPNLALDPNLTTYAQQWANYLAANNVFMHRDSLPATPGTSPATNSYWTINNPYYTQQYLGENIFSGTGYPTTVTTPPGTDAVASWISEKQYYSYAADSAPNPPPPAPATFGNGASNSPPGCTAPQTKFCGHYTQVVYRTTTYVGCGKATGSAGWTYVVCNFYPAGNYQGALPY